MGSYVGENLHTGRRFGDWCSSTRSGLPPAHTEGEEIPGTQPGFSYVPMHQSQEVR